MAQMINTDSAPICISYCFHTDCITLNYTNFQSLYIIMIFLDCDEVIFDEKSATIELQKKKSELYFNQMIQEIVQCNTLHHYLPISIATFALLIRVVVYWGIELQCLDL